MLGKLSRKSDTTLAVRYALSRWEALLRYCGDGRIEIGRVENRRSGFSLPVGLGGAFGSPPQSGLA
jgi:hypothetical protein